MLFNTLNLIFLNVTMPNWTTKICAQISLAGLYSDPPLAPLHKGVVAAPRAAPDPDYCSSFSM